MHHPNRLSSIDVYHMRLNVKYFFIEFNHNRQVVKTRCMINVMDVNKM
jgi:hypothetical protein